MSSPTGTNDNNRLHGLPPPDATYDVRLWVYGDDVDADIARFSEALREFAQGFPRVRVRWIAQKRDRSGGPSFRKGKRA
jgi:hypothetical protein